MPRLPQYHLGNTRVDATTYIKWITWIPQCYYGYPHAIHISCALKHEYSIQHNEILKWKTQFITTIAWDKHHMIQLYYQRPWYIKIVTFEEHEREREREIKHIAIATYPRPLGWTTTSSSWWLPRWWRWPLVMIAPSDRVPERALDKISSTEGVAVVEGKF